MSKANVGINPDFLYSDTAAAAALGVSLTRFRREYVPHMDDADKLGAAWLMLGSEIIRVHRERLRTCDEIKASDGRTQNRVLK